MCSSLLIYTFPHLDGVLSSLVLEWVVSVLTWNYQLHIIETPQAEGVPDYVLLCSMGHGPVARH